MAESVLRVAGGHGGAFAVKAGDLFALVDLEGQQAIDFVAFNAADLAETLSSVETRRATGSSTSRPARCWSPAAAGR